jgi:ADP-ribosylglycohydrolase
MQVMKPISNFRERVMGCWLGKAVGGTLGMPFEGLDGPLDLDFYRPVPTEMLPNDDLDLQVVWACVLDNMDEVRVDRHVLARAWLDHVDFPWDEYGVALRNLKNGLKPPLSGAFDNWFANGMGAPIRSEIWACLAPGDPQLAAAYAFEDACVDHADEGIWGEVFLAALESAAFVESDVDALLDLALMPLPVTSLVRRAVSDTRLWWAQTRNWEEVRERIVDEYGHENFTDAPMNIAFTILGWLAGEGDFSRAICVAVNCGKDTDCTGATVGSLMGILDPNCIESKWLTPIGRDLVLSPGIIGLNPPATLDEFTDLILSLHERLNCRAPAAQTFEQSTEHLQISVEMAFTPRMPHGEVGEAAPGLPGARTVLLSGTMTKMKRADFEDEILLLRYRFKLDETRRVRVMFNTPGECCLWLNNEFAFRRESGSMAPSLHRTPLNQWCERELDAGTHEFVVALRRPKAGHAEWVAGVGDAKSKQWIAGAFRTGAITDGATNVYARHVKHASANRK